MVVEKAIDYCSRFPRRQMPNRNRELLRPESPSAWTSDKVTRRFIHSRIPIAITRNGAT
jgi:hypothetical protein